MAEIQTEQQIDSLEEFARDIQTITPEDLHDKAYSEKLSEYGIQLAFASMEESDDKPIIPTDRRTRTAIRQITPNTLEFIKLESNGNREFEEELTSGLVTALGRLGVTPETVPELLKEAPKQQATKQPEHELIPKVSDKNRQFLEAIVTQVEEEGRWTAATTQAAATGFLSIYRPAKEKVKNNNGSHQEILNAIATTNTYSHAIASALSNLSTLEQTSRIDDMKAEIAAQLMLHADERTRRRLAMRDEYALASEPEIREFTSAIKGAQYETLSYTAIAEHKKALHIDTLNYSSLEEDITHGYDIVLTKGEQTYYIDIKAAGSFKHAVKKYPEKSLIANHSSEGYVVRQTSHTDEHGNPIKIVVIDAETSGNIRYHRNRLQLTTPKKYLETMARGIEEVDNSNK